jgi:hypothetical protein
MVQVIYSLVRNAENYQEYLSVLVFWVSVLYELVGITSQKTNIFTRNLSNPIKQGNLVSKHNIVRHTQNSESDITLIFLTLLLVIHLATVGILVTVTGSTVQSVPCNCDHFVICCAQQ